MKLRNFLILLLITISISLFSQGFFKYSNDFFSIGKDLLQDSSENYYLLGKAESVLITKYNSQGIEVDNFTFPNDSVEQKYKLFYTNEDEILIIGKSIRNGKLHELFVIKCDTLGNELYNKTIYDSLHTNWTSVTLDKHDNIYAMGNTPINAENLTWNWTLMNLNTSNDSLILNRYSNSIKPGNKILFINDTLYVGSTERDTTHYNTVYSTVYALDLKGELLWKKRIDSTVCSSLIDLQYQKEENCLIGYSSLRYIDVEDNDKMVLYKLNLKGDVKWSKKIQGHNGGIAINKNKIIVISENMHCHYINSDSTGYSCPNDSLFLYEINIKGDILTKRIINFWAKEHIEAVIACKSGGCAITGYLFDGSYMYNFIAKVDEDGNFTDISEREKNNSFNVFPTLVTNSINIEYCKPLLNSPELTVKLFGIDGRLILNKNYSIIDSQTININLKGIKPGNYIYIIQARRNYNIGQITKL